MARIYNSEGSKKRYQGRQVRSGGFSPNQVASNSKKIKQQGNAELENLKTQNRELQRTAETERVERSYQDQTDKLQLQAVQQQESQRLQLEQKVEGYTLAQKQLMSKGFLKLDQTAERYDQANTQQLEKNSQAMSQKREKDILRLQDLDERTQMGTEARAQQADLTLQAQQLSLSQKVDNANRAVGQSIINGLVSFGTEGIKQYSDWKAKEIAKEQVIAESSWVFSGGAGVVLPDGSINPVVPGEQSQREVDAATETAVVSTNPGNPIENEEVRSPYADATAGRNTAQASVGELASRVKDDLWEAFNSPETFITLSDGRTINPTEARTPSEVREVLNRLGGAIVASYGLEGRDKYAVVTQLVPQLKAGISEIRATVLPGILDSVQTERQDAAIANAAGVLENTGDIQEAWGILSNGYLTSGAFNGNRAEANEAAFKTLLSLATDEQLDQLGEIYKVTKNGIPQKGTQFKNDKTGRFEPLIQKERERRQDAEWNTETRRGREANLGIKDAKNTLTEALINAAGDAEATQAANEAYEATLRGLSTPESRTALLAAEASPNNYNPANYAGLRERVANGEILDLAEVKEQLRSGQINAQEYNLLVGSGGAATTMTELETVVGEQGLKNAEKLIETTIAKTLLAQFGGDSALAKAGTASIAADAKSRLYPQLGAFISNFEQANDRKPTQGEISQFVNGWVSDYASTQLANVGYTTQDGITGYDYTGRQSAPSVKITTNPVTGKESKSISSLGISQLSQLKDSIDIASDYVLTQKEIQDNLAGLESGQWTASLTAKAKALGVAPLTLLRGQTQANGYGDVTDLRQTSTTSSTTNGNISPEDAAALDVIGKYESDSVGGYNAVNQIGTDNGYGVLGFSGDSRNMPQHGGKSVADMTLAEIMSLQQNNSMSDDQWIQAGRLHAVGRYQFIGSTLAWVTRDMGIDPNTKFTPALQDQMALWLLKNSHNGIGQWVGPNAYASASERSVVNAARANLRDSNRILRNPNATRAQLRRASDAIGSAGLARPNLG